MTTTFCPLQEYSFIFALAECIHTVNFNWVSYPEKLRRPFRVGSEESNATSIIVLTIDTCDLYDNYSGTASGNTMASIAVFWQGLRCRFSKIELGLIP